MAVVRQRLPHRAEQPGDAGEGGRPGGVRPPQGHDAAVLAAGGGELFQHAPGPAAVLGDQDADAEGGSCRRFSSTEKGPRPVRTWSSGIPARRQAAREAGRSSTRTTRGTPVRRDSSA